jgi:hypothetical protein
MENGYDTTPDTYKYYIYMHVTVEFPRFETHLSELSLQQNFCLNESFLRQNFIGMPFQCNDF